MTTAPPDSAPALNHRLTIGVFPGTFDPLTNGHLDVIKRGQVLFDRLIVAVGHNPEKRTIFSMQERDEMIRKLIREHCEPHVEVHTYHGLTVEYVKKIGATVILRGLRNVSDLNFEFQLALTNRAVADIETVFVMTGEQYAFTSSSLIRQISAGGKVDSLHKLLPPLILDKLKEKVKQMGDAMQLLRQDAFKEE
jgi:pantetheine-phosphate adenylyltransferase